MKRILILLGILWISPGWAQAQTVIYNPTVVQFDSPDHTITTTYKMEFWLEGVDPLLGQPVSSYTAAASKATATGLTAPEPQWQLRFADFEPLPAVPIGNNYVARLIAANATGESPRSLPSGPFAQAAAPRSAVNVRLR